MKVEITREEYLNALELVDKYHRQFQLKTEIDNSKRKLLSEWILENRSELPTRLINILNDEHGFVVDYKKGIYRACIYLDEVRKTHFLRLRNAGKKSWNEFEYILNKSIKKP